MNSQQHPAEKKSVLSSLMTIAKGSIHSSDSGVVQVSTMKGGVSNRGYRESSYGKSVLSETQNTNRLEERNRPRHHSKRVPNLLAGTPLLPGPVTPNFVPIKSPEIDVGGVSQHQPIVMFPSFMLGSGFLPEQGPLLDMSGISHSSAPEERSVFDSHVEFPELSTAPSKKLSPVKFPRKQKFNKVQ